MTYKQWLMTHEGQSVIDFCKAVGHGLRDTTVVHDLGDVINDKRIIDIAVGDRRLVYHLECTRCGFTYWANNYQVLHVLPGCRNCTYKGRIPAHLPELGETIHGWKVLDVARRPCKEKSKGKVFNRMAVEILSDTKEAPFWVWLNNYNRRKRRYGYD